MPDVLQTTFEWPDKDLTMLYSATLASSRNRGKVFMGHDASMEVSNILAITVDQDSTRYAEKIQQGIIPTDTPFYTYVPPTCRGRTVPTRSPRLRSFTSLSEACFTPT